MRRTAMIGVIVALVAALLTVALVLGSAGAPESDGPQIVALPPGPPPAVEPLLLKPVAEQDARAINAAVPFSKAPNPAARPYQFQGDQLGRDRAIGCLAAAVLYEAGDDSEGQRAVAQVVLNRVRHPAYPKTVCGVVFQGSERRTGCQFTFTCDGALARSWSPEAWGRARNIAIAALAGDVYAPVGLATHYHTDWVVPYWSDDLEKITMVGTHIFFRWPGGWGRPRAFLTNVAAAEPAIGKLARLFAAHGGADALGIASGAAAEAAPQPGMQTGANGRITGFFRPAKAVQTSGDTLYITLDAASDASEFVSLAQASCGARSYCKLFGWTSAAETPAPGPIGDAARAAMAFSYLKNDAQSFEKALWDCRKFPRADKKQCMRR